MQTEVESVGCSDVCNTLARLYADDCGACLAATRASAVQKRRVRLLLASEGQARGRGLALTHPASLSHHLRQLRGQHGFIQRVAQQQEIVNFVQAKMIA